MNLEQEGISKISLLLQASHIWRTNYGSTTDPPTLIMSWIDYPICIVSILLQAFNVQMKIFSSTCVDLALCRLLSAICLLESYFIHFQICSCSIMKKQVLSLHRNNIILDFLNCIRLLEEKMWQVDQSHYDVYETCLFIPFSSAHA